MDDPPSSWLILISVCKVCTQTSETPTCPLLNRFEEGVELLGNSPLLHPSLGKKSDCLHFWWLSRPLGWVFPVEMDSSEAGKSNQNYCEKHSSGVFWLCSCRTLCISNCSLPVRQEPAREGARSLVLSRRVPGGLPRNREIRRVSKQAAGAEASACLKPVKMFSAECFHSDTSKVIEQKKNANKIFITSVLDPTLQSSQMDS